MKSFRPRILPLLSLSAIGCGYVGLDGLEHQELGGLSDGSGGTTAGDGDLGDGDVGDGDVGDGDDSVGGATMASGGSSVGAGGSDEGTGGGDDGSGGTNTTSEKWTAPEDVWSDPNRTGCAPFCQVYNPTYATHHMYEMQQLPDNTSSDNTTLSWVAEPKNWGAGALEVDFGGVDPSGVITSAFSTELDWVYMRAYLLVPAGTVSGDLGLAEFFSGDLVAARVSAHPDGRLSAEAPLHPERAMSAPGVFPQDEWFCLRIAVSSSEATGSVTVEAAGKIVAELTDVETRGLLDIDSVHYGVTGSGPFQGAGTIYWDSVIVDADPVDCLDAAGN